MTRPLVVWEHGGAANALPGIPPSTMPRCHDAKPCLPVIFHLLSFAKRGNHVGMEKYPPPPLRCSRTTRSPINRSNKNHASPRLPQYPFLLAGPLDRLIPATPVQSPRHQSFEELRQVPVLRHLRPPLLGLRRDGRSVRAPFGFFWEEDWGGDHYSHYYTNVWVFIGHRLMLNLITITLRCEERTTVVALLMY